MSHLHLQWYTLVDADHQIRVHGDHQIQVHGDHQEEISSGDWSRSSIHQIWHWLPPQYATVVIWSNLPDRQTCKTMSKLTQTKRLKKQDLYPGRIFLLILFWIYHPQVPLSCLVLLWGKLCSGLFLTQFHHQACVAFLVLGVVGGQQQQQQEGAHRRDQVRFKPTLFTNSTTSICRGEPWPTTDPKA